jgi:hypothetical protein
MPKPNGELTRKERSALNKAAFAQAREEERIVSNIIPLDAYRDESEDHLPEHLTQGQVLRQKRGDLTDAACIARIAELVARGVKLEAARNHIGVPALIWGEWRRTNHCNVSQQISFARMVRMESMSDEIFEIVDDPDLLIPITEMGEDEEGNPKRIVITSVQEKARVASMRVEVRKWYLEKLAPEFTPKQLQQITTISAEVRMKDITPQQAMDRYQKMLELKAD